MAMLRTRSTFAQIRAVDSQKISDKDGNALLEAGVVGTATSHVKIHQGNANQSPALSAAGTGDDVDLALFPKGDAVVTVMGDPNDGTVDGVLQILNSSMGAGFQLKPDTNSTNVYSMTLPGALPAGDAFLKISNAGAVSFATGSASSFSIEDDNGSDQTIDSGDVIRLVSSADQIDLSVSSTDRVTASLVNEVVINTSLTVPTLMADTIQSIEGTTALTINGANVTIAGDLTVSGDTVTLNAETLVVEDKNIVVANGAGSDANSNDAGIIVGTQEFAYIKYKQADSAWELDQNVNLSTSANSYKIAGELALDNEGARFKSAGLATGLDADNDGRPKLDIKIEETDIGAASDASLGAATTKRITVGTTEIFTFGSFFQVFLNGILQKGVGTSNAAAGSWLNSGSVDYAYDVSNGRVDFEADQVVDQDTVTIYYTK